MLKNEEYRPKEKVEKELFHVARLRQRKKDKKVSCFRWPKKVCLSVQNAKAIYRFVEKKQKHKKKKTTSVVSVWAISFLSFFFFFFFFFFLLKTEMSFAEQKEKEEVGVMSERVCLCYFFFLFSVDNKIKTEFVLTFLIFCSRQFQKQSKSHFNHGNKYKTKRKKVVLHSWEIAIVPQRLAISCVWKNGKKKLVKNNKQNHAYA